MEKRTAPLALLLLIWTIGVLMTCAAPAGADIETIPVSVILQGFRPNPAPLDVSLGRVYWNEGGAEGRDDHRLIFTVLAMRSRGTRPSLRTLRAYSSRASGMAPPRTRRQRWIQQLGPGLQQPANWTRGRRRWLNEGRPNWEAVLAEARGDIRRPPDSPCSGPVHHWGGSLRWARGDSLQACRAGWIPLRCGTSSNIGWCNPERATCPAPERDVCERLRRDQG